MPCPRGSYCDEVGASGVSGSCAAGFYCNDEGSTTATPSDKLCQSGFYCPEGTTHMLKCPQGKYQNSVGQSTCKDCEVGFYCSENNLPRTCKSGYYCPGDDQLIPCPPGTYNKLAE